MNRDLFLAILALDSYNRGYGSRLSIAGSDTIGTALGSATILNHSSDDPAKDPVKSDFYAISYAYNGETIISYRGTDNVAADALSGYGVGAGSTSQFIAPQAELAMEFYHTITEQNVLSAAKPGRPLLATPASALLNWLKLTACVEA